MFETTGIFPHPTRRQTQTQTQAVTDSHRQSQTVTESHTQRTAPPVGHAAPPRRDPGPGTPLHYKATAPWHRDPCAARVVSESTSLWVITEGVTQRSARGAARDASHGVGGQGIRPRRSGLPSPHASLPRRGMPRLRPVAAGLDASAAADSPSESRSWPAAMVSSPSVIAPAGMHLGAHLKMSARQRVC